MADGGVAAVLRSRRLGVHSQCARPRCCARAPQPRGTGRAGALLACLRALMSALDRAQKSVGALCLTQRFFATAGSDGRLIMYTPDYKVLQHAAGGAFSVCPIGVAGRVNHRARPHQAARARLHAGGRARLYPGAATSAHTAACARADGRRSLRRGHGGQPDPGGDAGGPPGRRQDGGPLWRRLGLAPHPTEQVFATTGHDKCVRARRATHCALYVLNRGAAAGSFGCGTTGPARPSRCSPLIHLVLPANARARAQTYEFKSEVRSCAFAPDGNFLAVGSKTGRVSLCASTRLPRGR
jgi:hypothetical protein